MSFVEICGKVTSIAALVFALAGSEACRKKQGMNPMMAPAPVRATTAVASDVPLTVTAVGTVESIASVDVKSGVAGQVLRVAFTEGQEVTKDQVLFEIDPEPLKRQIAQIQADLRKNQALEQQARANAARDEATMKQSRASADRGLALSKEGIFSEEQTEQVVATDAGQASLNSDVAAIESAVVPETRTGPALRKRSCSSVTPPLRRPPRAVPCKYNAQSPLNLDGMLGPSLHEPERFG